MIGFNVCEHGLGIITALLSLLNPPLTFQPFLGLLFKAIQIMIYLYNPVISIGIAGLLQRTVCTFFGLITGDCLREAGSSIFFDAADIFHWVA